MAPILKARLVMNLSSFLNISRNFRKRIEKVMQGKAVIVTGGSRGIGATIVKKLAQRGYNVILNYNKSGDMAEQIKKELENEKITIYTYKADVSDREESRKLIEFAIEKFKKIDVLINNAGISQMKLFTDITDAEWNNMLNVNLNSAFYCTQEATRHMLINKEGCIINITSIWGITGASCEVHYSTAKAALNGFTKALAKELGPSNIRVNAIAPGMIDTDMNNNITEQDKQNFIQEIPLEKIGETEDISKCVEWLIEDNYTTGQIISINGGIVI